MSQVCNFAKACMTSVVLAVSVCAAQAAQADFSVIYNFQGGNDGANPYGALIMDASGNMYGTTQAGGGQWCDDFVHGRRGPGRVPRPATRERI